MSSSVSHSSSLSKAAIGGIVCGVSVTFLILGIIIFILLRQRKTRLTERSREQKSIDVKMNMSERQSEARISVPQDLTPMNTTSQNIEIEIPDPIRPVNNFDLNLFPNPLREFTIRKIPEEEEEQEEIPNDTSLALGTNKDQSSSIVDSYKLPVIFFSDQAFPMPTTLLSTNMSLDRLQSEDEMESQDQLSNMSINNAIVSPRPTQSHKRNASYYAPEGEIASLFSEMPGHHTNFHPGFLMKSQNVPIKEKDRESPTLGVRNPVKISADSSSAHRSSNGHYKSDSESSRNSVTSINRHIISDEELEKLGIGPRI